MLQMFLSKKLLISHFRLCVAIVQNDSTFQVQTLHIFYIVCIYDKGTLSKSHDYMFIMLMETFHWGYGNML